ncbi:hypothetical protein M011DRAFT_468649 [Sporormia fimetaria CBS 119925]|uniref:Metallothionein-I gene transcription activator n=1 Tax=Sporormia fimetaria CBS 119925 TaxID=1340428 RepID=A0A6A6VB82_9PLEO|nr:hypothetical protein M011DRAFT_468649 [Sporormia fimetaria CBS 119925]
MSTYTTAGAQQQQQQQSSMAHDASSSTDERARFVEYSCGDCDAPVSLKRGEPIRCRSCGHRVLYKKRTHRMVQFEAR